MRLFPLTTAFVLLLICSMPTSAITVWNNDGNKSNSPEWDNGMYLEINPSEIKSLEKKGVELYRSGKGNNVYMKVTREQLEDLGMMDRTVPGSEGTEGQPLRKLVEDYEKLQQSLASGEFDKYDHCGDGVRETWPLFIGDGYQHTKSSCPPPEEGTAETMNIPRGDVCTRYPDLCEAKDSVAATGGGKRDGSLAKKLGLAEMPSWDNVGKDCMKDAESGTLEGHCGDAPTPGAKTPDPEFGDAGGGGRGTASGSRDRAGAASIEKLTSSAGLDQEVTADQKPMLLAKFAAQGAPPLSGGRMAVGGSARIADPENEIQAQVQKSGGAGWFPTSLTSYSESDTRQSIKAGSDDLIKKAGLLMQSGNLQESIAYLSRAAILDPKNAEVFRLLAKALNKKKEHDKAEKVAQEAILINRSQAAAYHEVVWSQLHLGKFMKALDSAQMALRLDPDDAWNWMLKALALENLGRNKEMIEALKKAAELDPRYRLHLLRAQDNLPLFNPYGDNEGLRNAFDAAGRRFNPWTFFGLAAALAAVFALAWWKFSYVLIPLKSRMEQELARRLGRDKFAEAVQGEHLAMTRLKVGNYELVRVIGRGTSGALWEAVDPALERRAAIRKMNLPYGEAGARRRAELILSAKDLIGFRHPGIVDLIDVLDEATGLYLVYEWIDGRTLRDLLKEMKRLPPWSTVKLVVPICRTLAAAHAGGITHKNLKPENIFVSERGAPRLMDFGFAPGNDSLYLSPQGAAGRINAESDVYALGLCFYEMLTGTRPFGDKPPKAGAAAGYSPASALLTDLPPAVDELIARILAPQAEDRIVSAEGLLKEVSAIPLSKRNSPASSPLR